MLRLYNSLTRQIEDFKPIKPPKVGMYTCGPTVYDYVHIGNFRTYTTSDLLLRTLQFNGFEVDFIMNITDVGHLTGDNIGDADIGEDRMEKASKREGRTAWEIAKFYETEFKADFAKLNLTPPKLFTRATEYLKEQIDLVRRLEVKGFTYKTSDGIYFDTAKFPEYGKLSPLDRSGIQEGARVAKNPEKRNLTDFALWKFTPNGVRRQMEWDSPWGRGFPGWHIECSAMSMKYLGETFDLHVGGEDLASTHHPNEIAQSEAATGKPFVHYWVHGAFMLVDGERMSKSLGNNYRLRELTERGYQPLSLRYLYLQTHYRQQMNFTWEALEGAQNAYERLVTTVKSWQREKSNALTQQTTEQKNQLSLLAKEFEDAVNNDLNMPEALAIVWKVAKSTLAPRDKFELITSFDRLLGLNLAKLVSTQEDKAEIPAEVISLTSERESLRRRKLWQEADAVRQKIRRLGWDVEDTSSGPIAKIKRHDD